jgi:hypothetical protein
MSCYMRHMDWLLEALDLPNDKGERKRVDMAIRRALELPEGVHCPEVWAAIKALSDEQRAGLPPLVREVLEG